jgi:hypothetical protein
VLIIRKPEEIERLSHAEVARCLSLTVVGIPATPPFVYVFGPFSGRTTVSLLQEEALGTAARVAREAVAALPVEIAAFHLAYASWQASSFLTRLRRGAFDVALFATWPPLVQRTKLIRAIRAGGGTVVRLPC